MRELEETKMELEGENTALQNQYTELMGELTTIKNQLMDHASCNDANIDQWLDNEAKRYVQRIAAQSAQDRQAPPAQPQNIPGEFYNAHRRSSSVATSTQRSIGSETIYADNLVDTRN